MSANVQLAESKEDGQFSLTQTVVTKRDGSKAPFDPTKIVNAIAKAFKADRGTADSQSLDLKTLNEIQKIVEFVVDSLATKSHSANSLDVGIEEIQDAVEAQLMKSGHYTVARRYIVYREERAKARALSGDTSEAGPEILVSRNDGTTVAFDWSSLRSDLAGVCDGFSQADPQEIVEEVSRSIYNLITEEEVDKAKILATRVKIEKDPAYAVVAARLLLKVIYKQVFGDTYQELGVEEAYKTKFGEYLRIGIREKRLSGELVGYDLDKLAAAIAPERDNLFLYMGLQTIYDRYLLHVGGERIEAPQYFWMRVAMGLGLNESESREDKVIEFYNTLSTFKFVSSTPTLFNAGTLHPQLSSCYLSTTQDDLSHIFKVISDNAQLSKWAGGLGNDWTGVRATGSAIKGTNGESQGVIPFLKVANDTAVAVNQGGKRKGAMCAYLESWHLEIEEFLELRRNTGDERRRCHDMNTANWIPDLFMKRVKENGTWTLFSPNEVPDLHDLYGSDFERRYTEYERLAQEGRIQQFKEIPATQLWRKMLSMLFETGHPWITFKDPSNIRSPQDHVGVVHSSNLCTEILLNTSSTETAVCNLGSVNLLAHLKDGKLDEELISKTVRTAVRMLDNVVDINFYPTIEAQNSNKKHRPVGLGLMGFQDALYELNISYASNDAVDFADRSMELISYYAILASAELAKERGTYQTYKGSKWDRGYLPIDTIELLRKERGGFLEVDTSTTKDWSVVREAVKQSGMRNSNVMAIAPTATIANIVGVTQSIEPTYRHLYVKSNLSGEFTIVNPFLVEDLKKLNLWDEDMIDDLKYFDGILESIERIPSALKEKYLTAFEIEPKWTIDCASRRQKWIDMGQSLNLYIGKPDGKLLHEMYLHAWESGLKTTYYLRSLGATQIEKSTTDINKRGIQPRWMKSKSASSDVVLDREEKPKAAVCDMTDPTCEACQ
jgi:ribonucleoside-diphosphate reductase alpha chain